MKQNSLFLMTNQMLALMFLNLTSALSNLLGLLLIASRPLTFLSTFSCTFTFLPPNAFVADQQNIQSGSKFQFMFSFIFQKQCWHYVLSLPTFGRWDRDTICHKPSGYVLHLMLVIFYFSSLQSANMELGIFIIFNFNMNVYMLLGYRAFLVDKSIA